MVKISKISSNGVRILLDIACHSPDANVRGTEIAARVGHSVQVRRQYLAGVEGCRIGSKQKRAEGRLRSGEKTGRNQTGRCDEGHEGKHENHAVWWAVR